jgi:hypothetical protein
MRATHWRIAGLVATFALVLTGSLVLLAAGGDAPASAQDSVILEALFDGGTDNFVYADDVFRNTSQPAYATGLRVASGGFRGGALQVTLGGVNNSTIRNMSGGWTLLFALSEETRAILSFRYQLTQSADYESDEVSQVLVAVDGVLRGTGSSDFAAQVVGNGNGGSSITTGWRLFQVDLGALAAGDHTIAIGGFNNKKTTSSERTTILIDEVRIARPAAADAVRTIVDRLDFERFKLNIRMLGLFGDRLQGTQRNMDANDWIQAELEAMGYKVERHAYTYNGQPRTQVFATKVGTVHPDQMYIVSAHMDGRGGGQAADDDASGCALVLEAARVLAAPDVQTDVSVRFIFWNNEESGLNGSTAYVASRSALQGIENPAGSGLFPEPRWLGIIQHDMILFDHGLPPQQNQVATADIDVEYQAASTFAGPSQALANALQDAAARYARHYPAQVGNNMDNTDSKPFRNVTAAVSVRENQRNSEIGRGANPHWHQPTDNYETYSEADFLLGFNTVQMTTGAVAELAGARLLAP